MTNTHQDKNGELENLIKMKKIIYLFALSILFQSCFSYKTVEYDNINSEKKQTLRIEKEDRTKISISAFLEIIDKTVSSKTEISLLVVS